MDCISQAGYTPMLYTGKPYIYAHVDVARFLSKYPSHLWLAAYPDYQVRSE
ncbi:GH25 family lysozyme, partial [Periweissella fabaria]|uniref:GH25 family lysozyme n=1 Tax=Periweissella fabaria TaxID=546157 RepID=UPI00338F34C4